jgi:hypothetical protein
MMLMELIQEWSMVFDYIQANGGVGGSGAYNVKGRSGGAGGVASSNVASYSSVSGEAGGSGTVIN